MPDVESPVELPRSLPMMKPSMLCKGAYHGPDNTNCIKGWAKLLGDGEYGMGPIFDALRTTLSRVYPSQSPRGLGLFNDNNSLEIVADLWNDAMIDLGYRYNRTIGGFIRNIY